MVEIRIKGMFLFFINFLGVTIIKLFGLGGEAKKRSPINFYIFVL